MKKLTLTLILLLLTPLVSFGENGMNEELTGHIQRNIGVWELWKDHGIEEDTMLTVNFHFYAASQASASALEDAFKESGYEYRIHVTKTLLIFKGWELETDITRTWTLNDIQNTTKSMYKLAEETKSSFDGLGAKME